MRHEQLDDYRTAWCRACRSNNKRNNSCPYITRSNHKKDKVEETEWLEVILWNNLALVAQQYYHIGDKVYVKGHLSSNSYEDKEGVTHNVTQIVADDIEKLSTAKRNIQEQSK